MYIYCIQIIIIIHIHISHIFVFLFRIFHFHSLCDVNNVASKEYNLSNRTGLRSTYIGTVHTHARAREEYR